MGFFLRAYRITAVFLWSVFIGILTIPFLCAGWAGTKVVMHIDRLWCSGVARIVNLHIKKRGQIENLPAGIVVANHISYVDIIALGSSFLIRQTAKKEVAQWPFLGWLFSLGHLIWIDRDSRHKSKTFLKECVDTVRHGIDLLVLPEGTTTDGKSGLRPFKTTAFEAAAAANIPLIPVLVRYNDLPGRLSLAWHGDMTLVPHLLQVLAFPKIEAEIQILAPVYPEGRNRKDLAAYVYNLMNSEYSNHRIQ